jgi:hypothetical protein
MVGRGAAFCIGQIFETEVFFPIVLDNFNDPWWVDELVGV